MAVTTIKIISSRFQKAKENLVFCTVFSGNQKWLDLPFFSPQES